MYRSTLISLLLCLLVACSSNSSDERDKSTEGPEKPGPGASNTEFRLGGVVTGLNGQLILSNGVNNQYAILLNDGPFEFPESIPSGELYNVRVEAKPEDHLCEIANSRNFLIRDTVNVIVRCAKAVEREIEFARPANVALSRLQLASNYQMKGAASPLSLSEADNTIQVFDNSIVSLSVVPVAGGSPEPIYLAHVHDMEEYLGTPNNLRKPILLNTDSTVQALVLLEPTIATALLQRVGIRQDISNLQQIITNVFESLKGTSAYEALENKVYSLIAAQKTLVDNDGEITEPLQALVREVANLLQSDQSFLLPEPNLEETAFASGVVFSVPDALPDSTVFTVSNSAARSVTINSDKLEAIHLSGFEQGQAVLTPAIAEQDSVTFNVSGPGNFGSVSTDKRNDFTSAMIQSGLEQHFFSGLNLLLGLQDPVSFNAYDCYDSEHSKNIVSELSQFISPELAVGHYDYSSDYHKIFDSMRTRLIQSQVESARVDGLFACDKFGVGIYIEDKVQTATEHVKRLLSLSRNVFTPDANRLDLFAQPKLTLLTASMNVTQVETTWIYSNALSVLLIADRLTVAPDQPVTFQAECLDPATGNTATPCELAWDFGDGFKVPSQVFSEGLSVQTHTYVNEGNYQVMVTAVKPEGVKVTQVLNVSVQVPKPKILVHKANGTPLNSDDLLYDFGYILVEREVKTTFEIANGGTGELEVHSLSVDGEGFSVEPSSSFSILPGESADVDVYFLPNAVQKYAARVNIESNDAQVDRQLISVLLEGEGVVPGSPAEGSSVIQRGDESLTIFTQRAKVSRLSESGLIIRIFGDSAKDLPQILLNVESYQGEPGSFNLIDTERGGCKGSVIIDSVENTFCTNTSESLPSPFSGTVEVLPENEGQFVLRYQFQAALNALACGSTDVSACETITVEGELIVPDLPQ